MLYPTRLSYTLNTEPQWRCDERHTKAIALLLNRCGTHETTLGSWMNDAICGCSVTQGRAVRLERDIPCTQGVSTTVVSSRQQQRSVCECSLCSCADWTCYICSIRLHTCWISWGRAVVNHDWCRPGRSGQGPCPNEEL